MKRPLKNDESVSMELGDEDLLDIDGSDDPTTAFSAKAVLARLRPPARKKRAPIAVAVADADNDRTLVKRDHEEEGDREDVRETIPIAMKLVASAFSRTPPAAAAPVSAKMAPKSPTISPAPPVKTRNANASYPPIAINVAPREPAMSMTFVSGRPSRAGWITAAVMGALILIGGSIKVASPKSQPAAEPPPVVATEPAPADVPDEPKVVTFGDSQGISIRAKSDAPVKPDAKSESKSEKTEPKTEPKKAALHVVVAAPKAAPKPAPLKADNSLAVSKDREDKIPATSHDAPASNASKAEQKKLKSIEQELADAQLRAASR